VWFLRCEECDCWAAARRLVAYWRERKELFGNRALRPLKVLSGEGALTEEDLVLLRNGAKAILPKDRIGRSVLLFDRSRIPDGFDPAASLRIFLCLVNFMSENEMTQTDGLVLVVRISRDVKVKITKNAMHFGELVRGPSCIKGIHFVSIQAKFGPAAFLQNILPNRLKDFLKINTFRVYVDFGETPKDPCREL